MATISLTDPTSALAELDRRQKLAALLQQQSAEPIQIQSGPHGIQAPIPWTAVLAKALQGGLAGYEAKKTTSDRQALLKQQHDEANQFLQGLGGIGAQPMPVQTLPQTPDLQLAPDRPQPQGAVSPQMPAAPPPQPGYAEQPGTGLTPQQQAEEAQSRALQATISGNPYLERIGPTLYGNAEKDVEQQKQLAAIDALPYDEHTKLLLKQTVGGPKAISTIIENALKPSTPTEMMRNYEYAKTNDGFKGSFVDYQQATNPNKFITKAGQGTEIFNSGDLIHPSGGGQPSRAERNNNPLNLTVPASGPWAGQTGTDGRFAVFASPQAGLAAADQNLQSYAKQGINTLQVGSIQ